MSESREGEPFSEGRVEVRSEPMTPPCLTAPLTYLTADLPGIGGVIKQRPEDFLVEEQPLYEPSGEGEHIMLFVEKRRQTTSDIVRRIAKMFHVSRHSVGYAGLKDKHALTRQHLTVHLPDPTNDQKYLERFAFTPMKLLWSQRHQNKLRRGHLAGNRFVIYVRHVDPAGAIHAQRVIARLEREGVPNYVGWQRFGYRQTNHELGRLLVLRQWQAFLDLLLGRPRETDSPATREGREAYDRGDMQASLAAWPRPLRHDRQALDALRQHKSPEQAVMAMDAQQIDFLVSAFQSAVFNDVLNRRLCDGQFATLLAGDIASKDDNHALFAVDEATATTENAPEGRMASLEIAPTGPMWGREMMRPQGQVLAWERQALAKYAVSEDDLAAAEHLSSSGGRRSFRVALRDPEVSGGVDEHGAYVRLAFELPRGSFATVVLREVMKKDELSRYISSEAETEEG